MSTGAASAAVLPPVLSLPQGMRSGPPATGITDAADIAVRFVTRTVRPSRAPAVLFIDGHSGSGKTTLAEQLQTEIAWLTGSAPQLLSMDELYPGWDGLSQGSAALATVLAERQYRRYDWTTGNFGSQRTLDMSNGVIVEGCGSISATALATVRGNGGIPYPVWVSCPATERRARAISRDGEMFAPHWDSWAAQEQELFARTSPIAHARETAHSTAR